MLRRTISVLVFSALTQALASCGGLDCNKYGDAEEILSGVPAAAGYTEGLEKSPDGASSAVHRQTYTLREDGTFVFSRTIEEAMGYLGADARTVDEEMARRLDIEAFSGVVVRKVQDDSPAKLGGLKRDDVIVSYSGKTTSSLERLQHLVQASKPGDPVELGVLRDGREIKVTVEIGSIPSYVSGQGFQRKLPLANDWRRTGIKVAELTDEVRPIVLGPGVEARGLLVTEVLGGGPAYFGGVLVRDCVVQIGDRPVATAAELTPAVESLRVGDPATFVVLRDGQRFELQVTPAEDAAATRGFNFLGLIEYEHSAPRREFNLIWDILWNYESCFAMRSVDRKPRAVTRREWGCLLNLIHYRGRTDGRSEFRVLWFLPIWWRSGQDS